MRRFFCKALALVDQGKSAPRQTCAARHRIAAIVVAAPSASLAQKLAGIASKLAGSHRECDAAGQVRRCSRLAPAATGRAVSCLAPIPLGFAAGSSTGPFWRSMAADRLVIGIGFGRVVHRRLNRTFSDRCLLCQLLDFDAGSVKSPVSHPLQAGELFFCRCNRLFTACRRTDHDRPLTTPENSFVSRDFVEETDTVARQSPALRSCPPTAASCATSPHDVDQSGFIA